MSTNKTFGEHFEDLRGSLLKILISLVLAFVICFVCKDIVFKIVLYPTQDNFLTYSVMSIMPVKVQMIATEITTQILAHLQMALVFAIILFSSYNQNIVFFYFSDILCKRKKIFF